MPKVIKAKPIPALAGWLLCEFDNQEKLFVDIRPSITGTLEILDDPEIFKQVYVDHDAGTVAWPGDLHIDSDTLYKEGIQIEDIKNLVESAKNEGNG
ncbi:DUF2442 domain-containing protein [Virgibacillus sp. DJP39]|uniref:DUF2442 domain-containing protein n=1 Tax=Virgibacillus sp. DJP39 TaxID=3409790 RepID=UPI003BB7A6F1